jgi:hypothetical protein
MKPQANACTLECAVAQKTPKLRVCATNIAFDKPPATQFVRSALFCGTGVDEPGRFNKVLAVSQL